MKSLDIDRIEWTDHPVFKGVRMKHLITGKDTAGCLSCHLVRIDPLCSLSPHIHSDHSELHEIIEGRGECVIHSEHMNYDKGKMAVIPMGTEHGVTAGEQGLMIRASFFPALM
jgi:quercetin dioxygenase-like cupin family protein